MLENNSLGQGDSLRYYMFNCCHNLSTLGFYRENKLPIINVFCVNACSSKLQVTKISNKTGSLQLWETLKQTLQTNCTNNQFNLNM